MYGLVPNKHQGSLPSEDLPLLLPPQVYKLVLLDLPGLLFFSTYTLLVLFWAEIYHQVPAEHCNLTSSLLFIFLKEMMQKFWLSCRPGVSQRTS